MTRLQQKIRDRLTDDQITQLVKLMRQAAVLWEMLEDRYEWAAVTLGEEGTIDDAESANDSFCHDLIYNNYRAADEIEAILSATDDVEVDDHAPAAVIAFPQLQLV